jgi:hypothetical protein
MFRAVMNLSVMIHAETNLGVMIHAETNRAVTNRTVGGFPTGDG